jgi:hypothetical protein
MGKGQQVYCEGSQGASRNYDAFPPRIPMLHADDLPGEDDWAVLTSLRIDCDDRFDHDLQHDRYGLLTLAPAVLD